MYEKLRQAGHSIGCDWTLHNPIKPYGDHPDIARSYAVQDLEGAADTDVFILASSPQVGSGTHTELGVAIWQHVQTGKPQIYVIGEHNDISIMYFHPSVKRLPDLDAVIADLS
jgi:hypothetical protein